MPSQDEVSEESPLLAAGPKSPPTATVVGAESNERDDAPNSQTASQLSKRQVVGIVSVLLIGVLVANADGSLVLATYGTISSEFNQLNNASWLSTSYMLAMCAVQPIMGKLSDIYGRKNILLLSYTTFSLGTLICGFGRAMSHVIIGRVVAGVGGAGMTVLVSILLADIVPLIELASWRSYVNVFATLGRSVGAPLGGFLSDTIGWRWSFLSQVPLMILATLLVLWRLRLPKKPVVEGESSEETQSARSKLAQIDFLGAFLLAGAIACFLLFFDLGGQRLPFSSPIVISLAIAAAVLGGIFINFESTFPKSPIFPPRLLTHKEVASAYGISALQLAAQLSMMYSVPLYFQVTQNVSNTKAGALLFPAVVGNAVGGISSGIFIKRTGRYKFLTILGPVLSTLCYILLVTRWHGHTNILESLYIIPGGFGTGVVLASTFIGFSAHVEPKDMAITTSGAYLVMGLAQTLGVSLSSGSLQIALRKILLKRLHRPDASQIIDAVLEKVSNVHSLHGKTKHIVIRAYVESLLYTHGISLILSSLAFVIALSITEKRLK